MVKLKKIRNNSQYFIFVFISLLSLNLQYLSGDFKFIMFHDSPYPIDTLSMIHKFSYVWRDIVNFGIVDASGTFLGIWYVILSPISFLTNNIVIAQYLFLFIISNLLLISTYHLCRYIGLNKVFSILVGILYLANPYSIYYVWRIFNTGIMLYAVLPLIFLCIMKIIRKEYSKKYIFILLFAEFLSLPSFANPAFYGSFLLVTSILTLSYSFIIRSLTRFTIKYVILKNLVILIFLILPVLPFLISTFEIESAVPGAGYLYEIDIQKAVGIYHESTQHINFLSLFSLTGIPPLYEVFTWFNYQYIYLSPLRIVVGLAAGSIIFVFLAISRFDKNGINKKSFYPFIIIFLTICLLLLKETGYFILHNFPLLLLAWRDPFAKFQPEFTLVFMILFSYCAQKLFKIEKIRQNKFLKVGLSLAIIFPIAYWTYPFISGNFIPSEVGKPVGDLQAISAFTDTPDKYMPAITYLKQDDSILTGNARVLVYPFVEVLWCDGHGHYWGNDILRFSGISTISTLSHINFIDERTFMNHLSDPAFINNPNYINIISNLGVKYILIKKQACGVDYEKGIIIDLHNKSKSIEEMVDKFPLTKIMNNDYYSLFEIPGKGPTPVSVYMSGSDLISNKKIKTTYHSSPQYHKIAPTEYVINFKNITRPFYIVLAESYDKGWIAINGKERIPDKYHFKVDNFANGWYIKNSSGFFNIKLLYEPQKYYEAGLIITAILIIICLFFYFFYIERKMKHYKTDSKSFTR